MTSKDETRQDEATRKDEASIAPSDLDGLVFLQRAHSHEDQDESWIDTFVHGSLAVVLPYATHALISSTFGHFASKNIG